MDDDVTIEVYDRLFSRCLSISDRETSTPESRPTEARPITSDFCGLAKMPSELLFMTTSYLSHPEIKAFSTTSHQFRGILGPQLLKSLKFLGTLEGLVKELDWFIGALEQRPRTFEQTRHITFQFIGSYDSQVSEGTHGVLQLLANRIGCCLKRGLHDVTFDIDLEGKSSRFNQEFRSNERWVTPRSVIFHRASGKDFETFLSNFEPETLDAVQLPTKAKKAHYNVLKSRYQSLRALDIDTSFNYNVYKQSPLRYLDHKSLEPILRDFTRLESLVLSESGCCKPVIRLEISPSGNLIEKVEALTETLKARKHLRRFAFGLWSSRVLAHTIHQGWPPALVSNKQLILDLDNLRPKPTRFEVDSWYINLLESILAKVPQLLELCILDRQRFYRGTRSKDGIQVRALCFEGRQERDKFPNSLQSTFPKFVLRYGNTRLTVTPASIV
ncbi:hypothetical protein FANTH_14184 [Fusarium anthophilum]|uniref:Uncharacterized protein n=1 Tax=Fusarium anthophilum TaxID=48485 RepID=A0A8H4YKE1_9HYPO|nr:hypothetical protein FANTH_14184 [Fusarium anthophilum]